jgi:hypothetical protein
LEVAGREPKLCNYYKAGGGRGIPFGDSSTFQLAPKTADISVLLARISLVHSKAVRQNLSMTRRQVCWQGGGSDAEFESTVGHDGRASDQAQLLRAPRGRAP